LALEKQGMMADGGYSLRRNRCLRLPC